MSIALNNWAQNIGTRYTFKGPFSCGMAHISGKQELISFRRLAYDFVFKENLFQKLETKDMTSEFLRIIFFFFFLALIAFHSNINIQQLPRQSELKWKNSWTYFYVSDHE